MLRVLHLRSTNFFGGPERQLLQHALAARAHGVDILLATFGPPEDSSEFLERAAAAGVLTAAFHTKGSYDLGAVARLPDWVRAQAVDVVCTHDYRTSIYARLARLSRRLPWLAFSRGQTREGLKMDLFQALEMRLIRSADRVVAVSGGQAALLVRDGVPPDCIEIVRNAALADASLTGNIDWQGEFGFPQDACVVVSAGRFTAEKGQADLVMAAREVVGTLPSARFVLFGEGPLREDCLRRVQESGLGDCIVLPGFRANVQDYLQVADVVVNPSLSEGLPNVLLEAMSLGRAVVATAVGGVPELVDDGASGLLVAPGRPPELAAALVRVLRDPALRNALARAGRQRVEAEFTFDGQARRLAGIYRAMVARRASGRNEGAST